MNETPFFSKLSYIPKQKIFYSLFFVLISASLLFTQIPSTDIKRMIKDLKSDIRGPYKDIRWFCKDGSVLPPKERCKEVGGFQRARYKDEVVNLGRTNHTFLGQILSGTEKEAFYDLESDYSRMKQYVIEVYLREIDDGWINKKAKYYRGSIQVEDEEAWGRSFLEWILESSRLNLENYLIKREMVKYIPHGEQTNLVLRIRSLSMTIADRNSAFMDIRTKIHGNPQSKDLESVIAFKSSKKANLSELDGAELDELIAKMKEYYQSPLKKQLASNMNILKGGSLKSDIEEFLLQMNNAMDKEEQIIRLSDLLFNIKNEIWKVQSPKQRLALMDISIILEQKALKEFSEWEPMELAKILSKTCYLSKVSCATGYIYDWEYHELLQTFSSIPEKEIDFEHLLEIFRTARKNINWGSALIATEFGNEIDRFLSFEHLAESFIDDRIRSSALLDLGKTALLLNDLLSKKAGWKNTIFKKKSASIQGINPGYAKGKLIVLDQLEEDNIDPNAIYVFKKSPSDLQPVAGILSISEGNLVSHLQLLARNLGIPNASLSEEDYHTMKSYVNKEVFFAVSNKGGVVVKLVENMDLEEQKLFAQKKIDEEIIAVPTESLKLDDPKVYSIIDVDAASSGVLCGPKAANFARLKKLFPENLVDGLVIPFSVFKDHMEQNIPGKEHSYWSFLKEIFAEVESQTEEMISNEEIEKYTFARLSELRALIKSMPLKTTLISDLETQFVNEFGKKLGDVPVFLRSDTNMEDLKDFTGAGLNLTVFNTISKESILQGIKDVWSSPYTERSYKWRQRFLTNPEDVYPSILVIPSVFVDYSGVIITKDFIEGKEQRLNIAFSQGVGGAVDGQKSESWVLDPNGSNILVAPARDRSYKYLSRNGGTGSQVSSISRRIVSEKNIGDIWKICMVIYDEMPKAGMSFPYDIELGFEKDKLWLFQIRPFVENKKAVSSFYLSKIDPRIPENLKLNLDEKINN